MEDNNKLYEKQIELYNKNIKRKAMCMGLFTIGSYIALLNINSSSETDKLINSSLLLAFGINYIASSIDMMKLISKKEILLNDINKIENEKSKKLVLNLKKEID